MEPQSAPVALNPGDSPLAGTFLFDIQQYETSPEGSQRSKAARSVFSDMWTLLTGSEVSGASGDP